MAKLLHDQRVFWRQFRQQFHTTGAVLPSGRALARALARFVGDSGAQQILEVGPGTGAVTATIVRQLKASDRLDLVELNDAFVAHLHERFAEEPSFCRVADQSRVLHQRLEELDGEGQYDLIISGLPLNNFSLSDVEGVLGCYRRLLRPGGTLSFFQYIAVRKLKSLASGSEQRQRLNGIGAALDAVLRANEVRRDWIWPNIPPAWVHHVRFVGR